MRCSTRAVTSRPPPAALGTTISIDRVGFQVSAKDRRAEPATASAEAPKIRLRRKSGTAEIGCTAGTNSCIGSLLSITGYGEGYRPSTALNLIAVVRNAHRCV